MLRNTLCTVKHIFSQKNGFSINGGLSSKYNLISNPASESAIRSNDPKHCVCKHKGVLVTSRFIS